VILAAVLLGVHDSKEGAVKKLKKTSFAKSFTTITVLMFLVIKLILSLVFFNYLRSTVIELTELNTKENVAHSQMMIVSKISDHEQVLYNAAIGMTHLLRNNNFNRLSAEAATNYLYDKNKLLPNSLDLYFSNNSVWNQPGGFAVFGSGWKPESNWDNTQRPWFIEAKKAAGAITFSEPYVDADTNDIIITLSMTVFNGAQDIGVIANDVRVNVLSDIVNSMVSYPQQEIYIVNADGLFITHDDIEAVLKNCFFTEKNLLHYRASMLESSDLFIVDKFNFIYSSAVPNTNWILVSVIPASVVFAKTNGFIIYLVTFTLVVFVCVTIITVVFAHRKITVPLLNVLKLTDSITKKEYNVDITDFSNDEIGQIQQALIEIRDKLKSGIDSLHDHVSEDEEKRKIN